jgi:hypothetical protein
MVKPSGRKAKGNAAEREFSNMLTEAGIESRRIPMSGAIAGWKGDIESKGVPIAWEVKNQETWRPLQYYRQAKESRNLGSRKTPIVVMKANRTPFFVFLDAGDFIEILVYALKGGFK